MAWDMTATAVGCGGRLVVVSFEYEASGPK
jgi:hypothetical protein